MHPPLSPLVAVLHIFVSCRSVQRMSLLIQFLLLFPPGNCHLKFISQRLQNKYTNKTILSSASSSPPLLQLHSDAGTLGRTLHSFNAKGEEQVSCQTTSLSSDHCHLQSSSSSCKPNKLCTYSPFSASLSSPLQCLNGISKTCFIAPPLWH